jgi:hypothetical protein
LDSGNYFFRGDDYPCKDVAFFYAELTMISHKEDGWKLWVSPLKYASYIPGRLEQFFFQIRAGKVNGTFMQISHA